MSVWRWQRLLSALLQTLFLLLPLTFALIAANIPEGAWIALGLTLVWSILQLWTILFRPRMAFDHWRFRLTSDLLEIRSGIWWKTVQILPLPKLQHADIRRGPIERQYGLATLIVYTAGTHSAVLVVPGLDKSEASQLRDKLVMESTRDEL